MEIVTYCWCVLYRRQKGRRLSAILNSFWHGCKVAIRHSSALIIVETFSRVQLFVTPWSVAHQAPLSMGLPRQEYWSGLPFPPPGHLPYPGVDPMSPELAGRFFTMETHSSILAWEIHGQSSPAGYGLWGFKEWNMTEWLSTHANVL